jgi:indole-3-glycerol phosphate synthase/phosphoribosylanthranilate isomerase
MALEAILETKREEVARGQRELPASRLLRELPGPPRPFESALRGRTAFLLECKRRSPSEGILREPYDAAAMACAFEPVADAISVVTDGPFFGGSLDDLRRVRRAVQRPVLRKDFVLDPWQVIEARWAGADAVLLMLSVLDDAGWRSCAAAARELDLGVLTEVHSEDELRRALSLGAEVIGINARNLRTLEVSRDRVARLAYQVPAGRLVVAESGIRGRADVRALKRAADAFLVGTALARSADPGEAARALVHGVVKVCGLTRPGDARQAWDAGATWGGLIFAESPRRVDAGRALLVRESAALKWAGVFADEPPAVIARLAAQIRLDAVQIHGDRTPGELALLRAALPRGCEIWKAVAVRSSPLPRVRASGADRLVADSWDPSLRGGTGRRFDWSLVAGHPDLDRIILAGGLDAACAEEADGLGAGMLDVCSGVESSPGCKSAARLRGFFGALRGRGRETAGTKP